MSGERQQPSDRPDGRRTAPPGWWLVFRRELVELWLGGRALTLLSLFSILLGISGFLIATNAELELIPPKEVASLMLQPSISFGLFIGLIIGADSISGERERATLEALLLTPTSRRQIMIGKFLAAVSPWPAALAISFPFVAVLSQWNEVLGQALLWGTLLGTVLALAFTGVGMLVSFWCTSNRTSLFVSLILYFVFFLPTQFPGEAQKGFVGQLIKRVNPMESTKHFLDKILVNNRTVEEMWTWLLAPLLFAVLVLGLLFLYAGPGLRFEAGRARGIRLNWRRVAGALGAVGLLVALAASLIAARPVVASPDAELPLKIEVDTDFKEVKTGDEFEFDTSVTYEGAEESPPLVMAMNIIDLKGAVVDPEDWSPQRTQVVEPLAPGESAEHTWTIEAILEGDYMVYIVAVPKPDGRTATSQPITTSGIHLTVKQFINYNPGGVLPVAVGIPASLTLGTVLLYGIRRRRMEEGSSL